MFWALKFGHVNETHRNWNRMYPAISIFLHPTPTSSQMSSNPIESNRIERSFAQTPGTEDFLMQEELLVLVDIKVRGGTGSPYAEGFEMIFCT